MLIFNRHFKSLQQDESLSRLCTVDAFLVADKSAIESYLKPATDLLDPGDTGGFVMLAANQYSTQRDYKDREAPGFDGSVYVLGSVLFDDVFAMLFAHSSPLKSLWPIAMVHPMGIYTGPSAPYQLEMWRLLNFWKMHFLGMMCKVQLESST